MHNGCYANNLIKHFNITVKIHLILIMGETEKKKRTLSWGIAKNSSGYFLMNSKTLRPLEIGKKELGKIIEVGKSDSNERKIKVGCVYVYVLTTRFF